MNVTIDIDTSYVGKMFTELKRKLNISLESVVHAEASSVAKTCALWSKNKRSLEDAQSYLIRKQWKKDVANFKTSNGIGIRIAAGSRKSSSGWRYGKGGVFFKHPLIKKGDKSPVGLVYVGNVGFLSTQLPVNGNKLSKFLWSEFIDYWQDAVSNYKLNVERKLPNIGFTRKTWLQVLMSLGYSFQQIKRIPPRKRLVVNDANTFVKRTPRNFGYSIRSNSNNIISITLINYSNVAVRSDKGMLQRAIASRQRAFEIALKKGVFDCEESVASRYGWIVTKQ